MARARINMLGCTTQVARLPSASSVFARFRPPCPTDTVPDQWECLRKRLALFLPPDMGSMQVWQIEAAHVPQRCGFAW
jgi:hypothetical protein